jgi:hypothetical protein
MKMPRLTLPLLALAFCGTAAAAATITVLVQSTAVRRRPQFYAPVAAMAKLGDTFDATGPDNGWYSTGSGYVHQSAVSTKKVSVGSAGSVGSAATADEVTLAGKGFNAQVEQSYGAQNPSANFAAVDAMQKREAPEAAMQKFLTAGGLIPVGGAQ